MKTSKHAPVAMPARFARRLYLSLLRISVIMSSRLTVLFTLTQPPGGGCVFEVHGSIFNQIQESVNLLLATV